MAVRRQCNRYRTAPHGTDFEDVLRRGKRFFRLSGEFMVWGENGNWSADSVPLGFKTPKDARVYKWNGKRWELKEEKE